MSFEPSFCILFTGVWIAIIEIRNHNQETWSCNFVCKLPTLQDNKFQIKLSRIEYREKIKNHRNQESRNLYIYMFTSSLELHTLPKKGKMCNTCMNIKLSFTNCNLSKKHNVNRGLIWSKISNYQRHQQLEEQQGWIGDHRWHMFEGLQFVECFHLHNLSWELEDSLCIHGLTFLLS